MKDLTESMWDFLHGAYEQGVLNDLIVFWGEHVDKDADLGESLGNMEDFLADADFSPMERFSEDILPLLLESLAQEKALIGLKDFLAVMLQWEQSMGGAGVDPKIMVDSFRNLGRAVVALSPVIQSLTPVMAKIHGPAVNDFMEKQAGSRAAGFLNSVFSLLNRNPRLTRHVLQDFMKHLDFKEMNRTIKVVGGVLWEQRPSIVRKPAATMAKSAKKQIFRKRGK